MAALAIKEVKSGWDSPFADYQLDGVYDEMFAASDDPRSQYQRLHQRLHKQGNRLE